MTSGNVRPAIDDFWAVIPAGGAGTRLWPLSRAGAPKFLHDLTGSGRTLIQATVDRLAPLCGERLMVVTGNAHAAAVAEQLPELAAESILAEPSPMDSMPAIGWAAALLEVRDPSAVLGSFAADHVIADAEAFRDCVREAVAVARTGQLVTIGIEPTFPSSGFGYIRLGDALDVDGAPSARRVAEFVEKPDEATAQRYLDGGDYRWNAGMFVVRASVLMDMIAGYQPELAAGLRQLAAGQAELDSVWPGLTKIAIDHAVAEPAAADGRVAVIPAGFDWDDVGDFASLSALLPAAAGASAKVLGDPASVILQDATGTVVTGGRTVVLLGLKDVVIVDTPDALLVASRERAQDVKQIVELLKSSERGHLT
ncbi:mannose-1-phosphate guanylyltransferase [Nakamurella lactea]|uniref:mannose-1-phosphate guanylyltransferase n=1 Tax=Nakamurella lactea TaxID=459515 RepID=UPI000408F619|nr:mannose-1-phosphate guanylyltransferase [Nakamurella lactea]